MVLFTCNTCLTGNSFLHDLFYKHFRNSSIIIIFLSIKNNILTKNELRGSKKYIENIQEGTKREPDGDKKTAAKNLPAQAKA